MDDHWYFSYGRNLAIDQKESRTGKIREVRRACLAGYRIVFNKVGSDGTGKANIWPDGTRVVWGIAYRCSPKALRQMDDHEGVLGGHYLRKDVQVECDSGEFFTAVTYVAGEGYIRTSLSPAQDYLHRILSGARSHGLPEDYIQEIRRAAQEVENR
ncbi:MAG TPA: gamma-glutamylcyclotransferase family protein [Nitrospira sp.]|nr:gamma-glutamylcyclotransferase family protein [Nitrospira sp.]